MKSKKQVLIKGLIGAFALTTASGACSVFAEEVKTDLSVASLNESISLLPWENNSTFDYYVIENVYDAIMDAEGTFEELQPRVCSSYEVSEDGLTYTFQMTDGVTFTDGTPVTAEDVAGSIMLYVASPYTKDRTYITDAKADGSSVVVTLSRANAMAAWDIASCKVLKIEDYNAYPEGYAQNPVGCGAYAITDSVSGSSVELTAYEDYYRGEAAIKTVNVEVVSDPTTLALGLQDGSIDYAQVSESSIAALEADDTLTGDFADSDIFYELYFNCSDEAHPELQNAAVRKAVASAVNRDVIVNAILSGAAEAENVNPVSASAFEYNAEIGTETVFDPEAAKQLLADVGIETPVDLGTLEVYTSETYEKVLSVIQSNLADVGINVELNVVEVSTYINDLMTGNYDMGLVVGSYYDSIYYASIAFDDKLEAGNNFSQYVNEDLIALFEEGSSMLDEAARQEKADQIQQILAEEIPAMKVCDKKVPIFYNSNLNAELRLDNWVQFYNFSWNN